MQLRIFSAKRGNETSRVFIQDSSCCRLSKHYLGNLMGRLCKEKGAYVALGEQSSIHQPDFLLCKLVVSQGALRHGTGEKKGSQALLAGGSQLQEWPFGHFTAAM